MADLITNMSIITLNAGALSTNQQTGRVDFYNHPVSNYMFLTRNYNIHWKEKNGKAVTIFKTKQSGHTNNTINQQSSWHIQNTPPNNSRIHTSLEAPMEHSPRQTISWAIKQTSKNLKELNTEWTQTRNQ